MVLNVRDFPDELNQALKVEAVGRGISLRELVIEKCSFKPVKFTVVEAYVEPAPATHKRPAPVKDLLATTCAEIKAQDDRIREVSAGVTACPHRFGSICPDCQKEGF